MNISTAGRLPFVALPGTPAFDVCERHRTDLDAWRADVLTFAQRLGAVDVDGGLHSPEFIFAEGTSPPGGSIPRETGLRSTGIGHDGPKGNRRRYAFAENTSIGRDLAAQWKALASGRLLTERDVALKLAPKGAGDGAVMHRGRIYEVATMVLGSPLASLALVFVPTTAKGGDPAETTFAPDGAWPIRWSDALRIMEGHEDWPSENPDEPINAGALFALQSVVAARFREAEQAKVHAKPGQWDVLAGRALTWSKRGAEVTRLVTALLTATAPAPEPYDPDAPIMVGYDDFGWGADDTEPDAWVERENREHWDREDGRAWMFRNAEGTWSWCIQDSDLSGTEATPDEAAKAANKVLADPDGDAPGVPDPTDPTAG